MVKLSSPACDWIVRGTADSRGREVLVWSTGLLDRLPPEITHPVIACARDEEGWAILMHDVSDQLIPDPLGASPITETDHRRYLALAALHADFGDTEIVNPALGYCSPWHRYTVFSPATGEREATHPNKRIRMIREGWPSFLALIAPDVAALLRRLLADPTPLCAAMAIRTPSSTATLGARTSESRPAPGRASSCSTGTSWGRESRRSTSPTTSPASGPGHQYPTSQSFRGIGSGSRSGSAPGSRSSGGFLSWS